MALGFQHGQHYPERRKKKHWRLIQINILKAALSASTGANKIDDGDDDDDDDDDDEYIRKKLLLFPYGSTSYCRVRPPKPS